MALGDCFTEIWCDIMFSAFQLKVIWNSDAYIFSILIWLSYYNTAVFLFIIIGVQLRQLMLEKYCAMFTLMISWVLIMLNSFGSCTV